MKKTLILVLFFAVKIYLALCAIYAIHAILSNLGLTGKMLTLGML